MLFYRVSVNMRNNGVEEFVSDRLYCKEWLESKIGKSFCGVVWCRKVNNGEELRREWRKEEIEWVFYRGYGGKMIWERWNNVEQMRLCFEE